MEDGKKARKNPDYSATALSLTNRPEVAEKLQELIETKTAREVVESRLRDVAGDIVLEITELSKKETAIVKELHELVDRLGGYQDMEAGVYAVKQVRTAITYDAVAFKDKYPKYASAVIEEVVNKKAVDGLIKGKLLDSEELLLNGVAIQNATAAYIVKV